MVYKISSKKLFVEVSISISHAGGLEEETLVHLLSGHYSATKLHKMTGIKYENQLYGSGLSNIFCWWATLANTRWRAGCKYFTGHMLEATGIDHFK
jgi:hypothetical protein